MTSAHCMVSELCGFTSPYLRIQYNANTPTVRTAAEDPTAVLYSTGVVSSTQSIIHRGLRVVRIACVRITINYCRVMAAMRIELQVQPTHAWCALYCTLRIATRCESESINALRVTAVRIDCVRIGINDSERL